MTIIITVLITLMSVGTINFFIVWLKDISGVNDDSDNYIMWTIGLGWIWWLIILPIYKLFSIIRKK